MRTIRTVEDVVDWGLCAGCGACELACPRGAISLRNVVAVGIRPFIDRRACESCGRCGPCIQVCPGVFLDSRLAERGPAEGLVPPTILGPALGIWEGHAADEELRFHGSSGGAISALALHAIEREGMRFALHTGMDPDRPWESATVESRSKAELIERAGSRYAPASPCRALEAIEASDGPCVFIGKPCDAAGAALLRRRRPDLDRNLGLVLTFFCAGTPSTLGTLDLLARAGVELDAIRSLRYRGEGWPGRLRVAGAGGARRELAPYETAWAELQRYRSMRCHLCPDGTGEIADISCGDAWHRFSGEQPTGGLSVVIARTPRGKAFVERARAAGYLVLEPVEAGRVIAGQGLTKRRQELFGRLVALRLLAVPAPRFRGFRLFRAWLALPLGRKLATVAGTLRRFLARGLWHRNPLPRPRPATEVLAESTCPMDSSQGMRPR